jgi:hypothetical protein
VRAREIASFSIYRSATKPPPFVSAREVTCTWIVSCTPAFFHVPVAGATPHVQYRRPLRQKAAAIHRRPGRPVDERHREGKEFVGTIVAWATALPCETLAESSRIGFINGVF